MGENITLGPGTLYINGQEFGTTTKGPPQLYELEAEDETDWRVLNWPKVNPALDVELTAEVKSPTALMTVFEWIWRAIKVAGAAYEASPPRVRHLALHARKPRTRKKNLRRIAKEYKKGGISKC